MASTYSSNLAIELIGTGEQSGTWGTTTNTNLGTLIEQSISGYVTQAITDGSGANTTITIPNGATGVARNMFIEMTGALTFSTTSLIVPANKKMYFIFNNTTGGFAVTVKVSGQTGILVPNGKKVVLTSNGTDIVEAHTAIVGNATMGGTLGITGTTTAAAINASGTVAMAGAATIGTTLAVTGTSTMAAINASGLVAMAGAATVGTTLGVTGTSTMAAINASGSVTLSGTSFFRSITTSNVPGTFNFYLAASGIREGTAGDFNIDTYNGGWGSRMTISQAGAVTIPGTLGVTGAITSTGTLTVTTTGPATTAFRQLSATGYGVGIIPGADTVYDALTINNAANTLNQIRMYGNGSATFAGGIQGLTGIAVGAATPGASGIAFPATAVAVADANTLDDYEEGTFTPTFGGLTVVGTPTYSGRYTKIGRLVNWSLRVQATTSTSSTVGATYAQGFPFVCATAENTVVSAINNGTLATLGNGAIAYSAGSTTLYAPTWTALADVVLSGFYIV